MRDPLQPGLHLTDISILRSGWHYIQLRFHTTTLYFSHDIGEEDEILPRKVLPLLLSLMYPFLTVLLLSIT